jgi:hypothetical protein
LHYEVAGQGAPLLLLHAGIADSRMWDEQFPACAITTAPYATYEGPAALLTFPGAGRRGGCD